MSISWKWSTFSILPTKIWKKCTLFQKCGDRRKNSTSTLKWSFLYNWWWVVSVAQPNRTGYYPFTLPYIKSPIKNRVKRNNIVLINLTKSLRKVKFLVLQIQYFRFYISTPQFSWNAVCEVVSKNLICNPKAWHTIKTEISHGTFQENCSLKKDFVII